MKNFKLSTILSGEISISIIIMVLLLLTILPNQQECKEIKIETYPITYQTVTPINVKKVKEVDKKEVALKEIKEKLKEINSVEDKKGWFLSYKELIDLHSDVLDPPETIYETYTEDEIYLIQRCVETECHGGDFDSKCNVASVIFNRVENSEFGDDITEVITAENQFAYEKKKISEDTKLAVEYVFLIGDTTNGCIAFHSNEKREKFNNWDYAFTDSIEHNFYY